MIGLVWNTAVVPLALVVLIGWAFYAAGSARRP